MRRILLGVVAGAILTAGIVVAANYRGSQLTESQRYVGAAVRAYALNVPGDAEPNHDVVAKQQVALLTDLNATILRMNLEPKREATDALVDAANAAGLETLLILEEPSSPIHSKKYNLEQLEARGYEFGFEQASHYKGKVKFYQLDNEVSGTAVSKPGDTGETLPNRYGLTYNKARYERVRAYLSGVSRGVHAADPEAKRVVTGHWVLIDIIKELIDDGVAFEIVGWDWYSDMGTNPARKIVENAEPLDLPGTVNAWGKEFWLVEVNKDAGSYGNTEQEQADYLKALAAVAENDSRIKGFIVHLLTDQRYPQVQGDKIGWLGLVELSEKNGAVHFGAKKPAFNALAPMYKRIANTKPMPDTIWDSTALAVHDWLQNFSKFSKR